MCVDTNFTNPPPVRRELLHRGIKFDFERLTFQGRSGAAISRECIRHPGSVIVAPLLGSGPAPELVMIRCWRLATERWMLELPAGTMVRGEDPAACAARELEEETGYSAGRLSPLCAFHTAPGLTDEHMHAFVARDLTASGQHLEEDERIEVMPMPLSAVPDLLDSGRVTDAKTLLVLHILLRSGVLKEAAR
jgi:ADP-ribose pyrophosphatase